MPSTSLRAVLFGLAIAGTTSASVSLASFKPRVDILSSQCATVYNAVIPGCTAEDFNPGATCTAACVQGLVKISDEVVKKCADVDVGETSIIGVFQNGLGVRALCPKAATSSTVAASPSTTKAPLQQSSKPAVTSAPPSSSSSSSSSSSEEDDDEPTSTSSMALIIDPSATATFVTSTVNAPATTAQPRASSSPAAQPSRVANSQLSNSDSGGGSPFDVVATGSSSQLRMSLASLLTTALLFVAYA